MIDVGGLIAATARIDAPISVQFANPNLPASGDTPRCLAIGNFFARELAHLPSRSEGHGREATPAIDAGLLYH